MRKRRFIDGFLVNTPATVQELTDAVYAHFAAGSHPFYISSCSPDVWNHLDEHSGKGWTIRMEADANGDLYHVIYNVDVIHVKTTIRKNDNYDN